MTPTAAGSAAVRSTAVIEQRAFRDLLGGYPTGVVVVTAAHEGDRHGMAVNSFTSVSLDPPLVSFCAARSSTTWPSIRAAGCFAATILAESQAQVCRVFAQRGVDRFAEESMAGAWTESPSGAPVLPGGLGWLDCTIDDVHPAGDHELVVGRVREMSGACPGRPLLYFRSGYARLLA